MSAPGSFRRLIEDLSAEEQEALIRSLTFEEARAADLDWRSWAHDGQSEPAGCPDGSAWRTWVIKGGRGFGKTLAGSQWITSAVAGGAPLRIALVGATLDEARRVMVEGKSGLLEVADAWVTDWQPSRRLLKFRTGAEATLFSGAAPEQLRGPEHHLAWCDELAKWEKPQETWDMLQLGLRLGERPRVLVTTTPRPGPVLRAIMAAAGCVTTGGPTRANPHLPAAFVANVHDLYAGTRLARQELEGELLTDLPGALWTAELLEKCRIPPRACLGEGVGALDCPRQSKIVSGGHDLAPTHAQHGGGAAPENPPFLRIVIGVDPPAADGTCGIVACALDMDNHGSVLADHSVAGRSPEGWARAVAAAAELWGHLYTSVPVHIVAEANQGGRMVESVLRAASAELRVKLVHASEGKAARADPVAALFETGRVTLHGRFPELEAELCGLIAGGAYDPPWSGGPGGPGKSPDRADAMVWALTELMLGKPFVMPRVRFL